VLPLQAGALTLGRESTAALAGADRRMSRAHAEVRLEGQVWTVHDLASRNGTFVDGTRIEGAVRAGDGSLVRLGDSVFVLAADVRPFRRGDLHLRVAEPETALPPLLERREGIPWLVARELRADDRRLTAHPTLVEACMRKDWKGDVRELLHAVRGAADLAAIEGTRVVRAEHLGEAGPPRAGARPSPAAPPAVPLTKEQIEAALQRHGGNMVATASSLGLHRRKLYRLLARHGIARVRA
jgi:predicted component of type VI protein secretion system